MHSTHKKTGNVYEVMHIAKWAPGGEPADMAEVHVFRDMAGEVRVQLAVQPHLPGAQVICGGHLQVDDASLAKLSTPATVVVYLGRDTRVWVRELGEFNARFEPAAAAPVKGAAS